jgi:hypothetical protein
MVGEPHVAMRVTSQIWQVVFASQTLPVFCFSLRKKAQYVVVNLALGDSLNMSFGLFYEWVHTQK